MADVQIRDGVGIVIDGDCASIVWKSAARIERARWMFEVVQASAVKLPEGIMILQVILPSSNPPDKETRAASAKHVADNGSQLRRIVTVPVGDAVWMSVVRTIMRAMYMLQRERGKHVIADTIEDGIKKIVEARTMKTPTHGQIAGNVNAILRELEA